jgi:hypothetical protein
MYSSRLIKPRVSEVKGWVTNVELSNENATVAHADIDDFFMKVSGKGFKTKYFYGENAWSDSQRYADDQYNPHL